MTDNDTWELIRLEGRMSPELEKIMESCNTEHPKGVESALRQAMWIGICIGKGWMQ